MLQLMIVVVPRLVLNRPPPRPAAELPLTVTPRQRGRAPIVVQAAAIPGGIAARDGQATQGGRHAAIDLEHPARPAAADVKPAAGPVIEVASAVSNSSSWAVRVIVFWVAKTAGSKVMVEPGN